MRAHKSGFTLIELLVVIVIIVILMGISLQVAKTANERTKRAQTVRTMEALRNALAGYYAAYGQYPPDNGHGTAGTYPGPEMASPTAGNDPDARNGNTTWQNFRDNYFKHGLLFYLMANKSTPGDENDTSLPWFPRAKESATAQRWQHYLEDGKDKNGNVIYVPGIVGPGSFCTNLNLGGMAGGTANLPVTNQTWIALDGWQSEIQYTSSPPDYQSYRLWSVNMTNGWEE